jgi:2,3-bisphosphoglycerate-independent phosphoglycerate mutase
MKNKVIFIIRDGWGYRKEKKDNAIFSAKTPNTDYLEKNYPTTLIKAAGEAVGLPRGYQGNSEVGHITIGSGRIVRQNLTLINDAIREGAFFKNKKFLKAISNCKKKKSQLHIAGLLQKEGVHAHTSHLYALLDLCKKEKFKDVFIHVITDGRDSPVNKSKEYLGDLEKKIKKVGLGEIVSMSGRYYAMDRDNRWERTKKTYNAIVEGRSKDSFDKPLAQIKDCYKKGETDEFIVPRIKKGYEGLKDGDSFIFYNFRSDRPRQLTKAIIAKDFNKWRRAQKDVFFVPMTDYYKDIKNPAFKENKVKNILGEIVSQKGVRQLRISETEKYAHVTFFFNNQREKPFNLEDRILIPSLKIATYDLSPEMKARAIAIRVVKELKSEKYGFVVVNLVNADMVGHSGDKKAIKRAVEEVDRESYKIVKEALLRDYNVFLFADHGNAEDQRLERNTSHTTNPVKLTFVSSKKIKKIKKGELKDIAPTVLEIMGIKKPKEMEGESLFK